MFFEKLKFKVNNDMKAFYPLSLIWSFILLKNLQ